MAGTIYTPVNVWKDFEIDTLQVETLSVKQKEGISIEKFYLSGSKTSDGTVQIFCTAVCPISAEKNSAIIVVPDFKNGTDVDFMTYLAKKGYSVFCADIVGESDAVYFTRYPKSVSYANYNVAKGNLFSVKEDVKKTCWHEWAKVYKYLAEYVYSKNFNFVGGIGIGSSATVMYHVAINENRLNAVSFLFNAGWEAQKEKYGKSQAEEDFSDEKIKYLAGIEPEAYVPYINCPMFFLSATNSSIFEMDRTADTVIRAKQNVYAALDYSVNEKDFAHKNHLTNILYFFDKVENNQTDNLAKVQDLNCEVLSDRIRVVTKIDGIVPKKVSLYVAEGNKVLSLRVWSKVQEKKLTKNTEEIVFEYFPNKNCEDHYFFIRSDFENGYRVGSNVVMKKTGEVTIKNKSKGKVIFSSREKFSETVFRAVTPNINTAIDYTGKYSIKRIIGPMDIEGVSCLSGLETHKTFTDVELAEDSVLVSDVFVKSDANVKFSLVKIEEDGKETEYSYTVSFRGEQVWYNIKTELNKFKSEEGQILRSFDGVLLLRITADSEFAINNLLWV